MQVITWEKILKTFLSVQCIDGVLNATLVIVIWENYEKLSYVVITVYLWERSFTLMSSFSIHEKHVRNPATWSRLGPIDFSTKIFTVCMDWVKLVGIIFWKTVVNTSRRNLKMWISRRRRRRWVLYLNDYGSNKEFGEFGRRVHQRYQFRRVNDPDFCWTF